jgi:hypothetical protein
MRKTRQSIDPEPVLSEALNIIRDIASPSWSSQTQEAWHTLWHNLVGASPATAETKTTAGAEGEAVRKEVRAFQSLGKKPWFRAVRRMEVDKDTVVVWVAYPHGLVQVREALTTLDSSLQDLMASWGTQLSGRQKKESSFSLSLLSTGSHSWQAYAWTLGRGEQTWKRMVEAAGYRAHVHSPASISHVIRLHASEAERLVAVFTALVLEFLIDDGATGRIHFLNPSGASSHCLPLLHAAHANHRRLWIPKEPGSSDLKELTANSCTDLFGKDGQGTRLLVIEP